MTDTFQGIIPNLDESSYHAHPALSSTGLVKLLQAPAKYKHYRDNPEPAKKAYDVGSAVHGKVLGVGAPVTAIPAGYLAINGAASTKEAKAFIQGARDAGKIPVKQAEYDEINAIAESVLAHPLARSLFEQEGQAEASVFATDPETGVQIRCRFDYLADICVDLKTSAGDASEEGFSRTVAKPELRYDVRQEFYLHTYGVATGEFAARMKFVVVEKTAPYLVGVHTLSEEYAEVGRMAMRKGINTYAACLETNMWPGYPTHPDPIQPPMWLLFQEGAIA
ncbi:PD-(D/E)XK nuclease-like domain-containing protein [Leifsonia sp. ZF2019]|uniref:PD-(D/E)XK nuclease-like domain-containing protein n=1 Tax=Leifsonia sp. ZF2019 TaxID=2781978 RepID=UPI001CBEC5D0|nr:PD-(D/E)XK nuclease-like domain-containing protein [Leifsonia sp. ZF2019]UAJ78346.1 PD-(D/E)XK nuclease-like domain-containing protein [Leifsonia sp. ZF2019]